MKGIILITVLCIAVTNDARAHQKCDKTACAETKAEIRDIQSKMRSGYTRAQGEKYEARLRRLRAKRAKLCR